MGFNELEVIPDPSQNRVVGGRDGVSCHARDARISRSSDSQGVVAARRAPSPAGGTLLGSTTAMIPATIHSFPNIISVYSPSPEVAGSF